MTFVYNATYNESVVLPFMGGITLPELPPVEGYVLNWCSADNSTCNPDEMLTQNLTLYPIWTIPKLSSSSFNPPEDSGSIGSVSRYVKITFDIENIWTSEVEAVIKEHGGECKHKIVSIDDLGSTTDVTIMFDEVEDAESFLSSIVASRKHAFEQDRIIKIVYVDESLFSGGCIVKPFTFLHFFSSIFLSTFIIIII